MVAAAVIGAAGAIVAGGSIPALAVTTSGVRYDQGVGVGVGAPGGTECSALLLSAAASTGSPAYVSAMVENTLTSPCTGWLESSVNGGAWTNVSPEQSLPAGQGFNNFPWYKTANYYAGPGTSIRACVQPTSDPTPDCGGSLTLPSSTAAPASDATSLLYARNGQAVSVPNGTICTTYLNTSTLSKTGTSEAVMVLRGVAAPTCTGWLESSTDNGVTWEQATPTYSVLPNQEWAFSPSVADGTGQLVRACVQGTGAKVCTAAW